MTETATLTGNHLGIPKPNETNPNLLSPEVLNQRRGSEKIWKRLRKFFDNFCDCEFYFDIGSRRPSILPVPDMFTSSSLNISGVAQEDGDESEDELEDEVPWRSPSEKIAYV